MAQNRISRFLDQSRTLVNLPVYSGKHSVLVVSNPEAEGAHDKVTAFAVEQGLAGRGKNVSDAIFDLFQNLAQNLIFEFEQPVAEYRPNPDPEMQQAYKNSAAVMFDGAPILRRQEFTLTITRKEGKTTSRTGSRGGATLVPEFELVTA